MQRSADRRQGLSEETWPATAVDSALSVGEAAFGRLARYDPAIADNFQLPACMGQLIACWSRPRFVAAAAAEHMQEADYVVGLVLDDHPRAYPLWVCDHYHAINDRIGDTPLVFVSCERCQSGAAFLADVGGRASRFASRGIYNATLLMQDSRGGSNLWVHYEGAAITGPRKGEFLQWIPTFHMTWAEWRELHPDTDVMLAPEDPAHRDARHGHGREEYFARPGMDRAFVQTIVGSIDSRYPENEPVLGLNVDAGCRVYPLREVRLAGGVVHDELGGVPIAVFAGPRADAATMAAYCSTLDERQLQFDRRDDVFVDRQTGSLWTVEGLCTTGPLEGRRLSPIRWSYVRWHAWAHSHPSSEIFRWEGSRPLFPEAPAEISIEPFDALLEEISTGAERIEIEGPVINLLLPHECETGLSVTVDGDPYLLFDFADETAAHDFVELECAWFSPPLGVHLQRRRARRFGRLVLVSDPEVQYADPCNVVRLPDEQILWGPLVEAGRLPDTGVESGGPPGPDSLTAFLDHLKEAGFDVVETAFLPPSQLHVGAASAIAATINGNRFAIYKCRDAPAAERIAALFPESVSGGRFALRPSPVGMHEDPINEIGMLPDDEISWVTRLKVAEIGAALETFVAPVTD